MKTAINFRLVPVLFQPGENPTRRLIPRLPASMSLFERQRAISERSAAAGLPVRYIGTMPLFENHRVYPGNERDWVLLNLADDPLFRDPDGFPMPRRALEQVRQVSRVGIDFDGLYIAHEVLPGTVSECAPITGESFMPPASPAVTRLSAQLGRAGKALWAIFALPLAASGVLMTATAEVVTVLAQDPVLLGVVTAAARPFSAGEPAAWFYIGHWDFAQET